MSDLPVSSLGKRRQRQGTSTSQSSKLEELRQTVDQIYKDESILLTLITDRDVLDCFICYERLSVPVFQCENGHTACSTCCDKVGKKCPTCSMTIGIIRNRTIEKLLESMKVLCVNAEYGCKDLLSYNEINEHQRSCIYEPCVCPHSKCDFVASSKELSLHFSSKHMDSAIKFEHSFHYHPVLLHVKDKAIIFQEKNDGTLFILNNYILDNVGNAINLSCIGPKSSKQKFRYEIWIHTQGKDITFRSVTYNAPGVNVNDIPSSEFLLIPSNIFDTSGKLKLDISIRSA